MKTSHLYAQLETDFTGLGLPSEFIPDVPCFADLSP